MFFFFVRLHRCYIHLSYVFPHYYSIIQTLRDNSCHLSQFTVLVQFKLKGNLIHNALARKLNIIVKICLYNIFFSNLK